MEVAHSSDLPAPLHDPVPVLAAYYDGVAAICQLAGRFDEDGWNAQTPCPEWRASEVAGHLRCVADNYHEYLDEAPASRYARLMATGSHPETISRKLARQNSAELAALSDAPPAEHIAAFAAAARAYASRLAPVWDLPHHQYRDSVVTVASVRIPRRSERRVRAPVLLEVKPGLQLPWVGVGERALGSGTCEALSQGC